ncbi:MAG: hypothetical protein F6K23_20905 [Okeania sp. SIO2C9]|uniref:carbonic anhydrase n=1 Tax=Okeania sp. SIO2C9 TaxID=2607791 RepID=UPI0013BF658A|nr:hypothetical protein [Okeania sp. SIO2C9]
MELPVVARTFELPLVREAGNIVTLEETGSIEYSTFVLGSKVLMVLGHENCGH